MFSPSVTFLYGPVGTGKSTVARLIDYCLGGELERTPAVQKEFVSAQLFADFDVHTCTFERSATDTQYVRVSWSVGDNEIESINAPLEADAATPILGDSVYNLSDLLFHLCGVTPIKVRKRMRDPDSPMIRLSFRDIWWYCYLDQTHLDSSFFRMEDPFRSRKSQDAMRFFTGLHSERLSELETELYRAIDQQKGKREAAHQIREFMDRFELGSELDVESRIENARRELSESESRRSKLERERLEIIHPTDPKRTKLREMSEELSDLGAAIKETEIAISEQRALRAELITAKVKADRTEQAGKLLDGVSYMRCPDCSTDISLRQVETGKCRLCCSETELNGPMDSLELEAARRELNDRIDQLNDSIQRRERALAQSIRNFNILRAEKIDLDRVLQQELSHYDSAFIESVRSLDRENATLTERIRSLEKLRKMPESISELEDQAAQLQGKIDRLRAAIELEGKHLQNADENAAAIAINFKAVMLSVGFPGVSEEDEVIVDPRSWRPVILHDDQEWTFWEAGSGGKKTLFNVCYALAVHETARDRNLPVPNVLIIDSPTKNISEDMNPDLVKSLYREIYRLASGAGDKAIQFLLIDSDVVEPEEYLPNFLQRGMAGVEGAPSLIPYYEGP
ncbi:hypothetical protein A7Y00_19005 [Stenotrophomonas maltophilia]|jgi:hypothetical protein|uniref:AAA family ATPase n=2 Tax=Bacteria TaxID=2 RepID=UPI000DA79FEE|nr:AAA family ATPase [Stenotrophomonas sp. PAMC25021]MBH1513267.1 AAA family ATPase [Stenotrophomonas maltophilia]MBH1547369.1 AAA family ATPase [Stenotrophomonas maltophilia]MBH1862992.1 AAA family ATPase [Stenotrophomonas maltophilia]MBN5064268.1 AAA family ATPase [Stenotrophomonas maltophilia]MCU1033015.1 AAA family ATPase [Stenotrophomonas maltophilia]